MKCVVGREKLRNWSRLWDEVTQEEIWEGSQEKEEGCLYEKDGSLVGKSKDKNKDMRKVK
jgi:hypothetical protein